MRSVMRRGCAEAEVIFVVFLILFGFLVLLACGCDEAPDPVRQRIPPHLVPTKVSLLEDGEAAWVTADALVVDQNRYLYLNDTKFTSSAQTPYRVFRYNDNYDIYMEEGDFKRDAPKPCEFRGRRPPRDVVSVTNIIFVDDINEIDLDIAKRLQRKKELSIPVSETEIAMDRVPE